MSAKPNNAQFTLNCQGQLIALDTPKVMGILNLTPDSFYDGGQHLSPQNYLAQAEQMLADGAAFIDLGAASTRPGADLLTAEQEIQRLIPALDHLVKAFPQAIWSIDTYHSRVAQAAHEHGAHLINDISAGMLDPEMLSVVAHTRMPYILMHMRGNPQTMQTQTHYTDLVQEMLVYFSERLQKACSLGINDLIIDPGFGFAKTQEQNFEALQKLELFHACEVPVLVGLSRKSMIYKTLQISPEAALNGTICLNTIALFKGAKILRVHDVKPAVETIRLLAEFA